MTEAAIIVESLIADAYEDAERKDTLSFRNRRLEMPKEDGRYLCFLEHTLSYAILEWNCNASEWNWTDVNTKKAYRKRDIIYWCAMPTPERLDRVKASPRPHRPRKYRRLNE
jgi:hypothetical protein